jgi:2-oxoisovalerate dehydrogenase E1 component
VPKYVQANSRGNEAIQIATAMQLLPQDYAFPYYRDDSMLLSIGLRPLGLMLQLMAKRDDPFSGGRTYYCHPSLRDADKPKTPHQLSATGMQAIPATGAAMGFWYLESTNQEAKDAKDKPIVVCSLGDAFVTEAKIAEAYQIVALKQLLILYLVQDNVWDISANAPETPA